ncbi:hypothetical protein BKA61DRAFT_575503 [Leptodontidium sp. MPI-SDFR-AT-0119]|nr:hypothetical protein BKA61DRAFT_575503 [Leptodontidium sp. MPI-SDFR-AT-0119]
MVRGVAGYDWSLETRDAKSQSWDLPRGWLYRFGGGNLSLVVRHEKGWLVGDHHCVLERGEPKKGLSGDGGGENDQQVRSLLGSSVVEVLEFLTKTFLLERQDILPLALGRLLDIDDLEKALDLDIRCGIPALEKSINLDIGRQYLRNGPSAELCREFDYGSYTAVRQSNLGYRPPQKIPEKFDKVGNLNQVPIVVELPDETWEMVVLK